MYVHEHFYTYNLIYDYEYCKVIKFFFLSNLSTSICQIIKIVPSPVGLNVNLYALIVKSRGKTWQQGLQCDTDLRAGD